MNLSKSVSASPSLQPFPFLRTDSTKYLLDTVALKQR